MPNERWAKTIFKDDDKAYEKLYLNIMKMCMIDKKDPVKAWQEYIEKNNYYKRKLNDLKIKSLHYTNSFGTDLIVGLSDKAQWLNLDKTDAKGGQMIANMPSYEIFTTPDCRKTNGIVYSSRPLIYNGCYIDNFSIEFKDGKAISCNAEAGQDVLEELIFGNEGANHLGEVALVPYDSPISNTGLVFNTTLFDENASCHLALGDGYRNTVIDGNKLTPQELKNIGFNTSKTHVDFMIGTSDLEIEAETKEGKKLIFKNGNFNI
jgi:aminopeptidase